MTFPSDNEPTITISVWNFGVLIFTLAFSIGLTLGVCLGLLGHF